MTLHPYNICVLGVTGRMGILNAQAVFDEPACHLSAATVQASNPKCGQPIGTIINRDCNIIAKSDAASAIVDADCVIDFTHINALSTHAKLAAQAGANYMCGITGLQSDHWEALEKAAIYVPVFYAANTSIGINMLATLVKLASQQLPPDYDIHIHDDHHRFKRDAPSGTSLLLGQECAEGRNQDLSDLQDDGSAPRTAGTISFSSARGGAVVGNHTVSFMGKTDRIDLSHHTSNRAVYAHGALRAALWLRGRKCGQYTMHDMLTDA